MITLIFNADDFGYSKGVNLGIIDAHQNGVVTSATLMMNMPGTEHAIELAKQNPSLGLGIHLALTCGRPLSHRIEPSTILDTNGNFYKNAQDLINHKLNPKEIELEWKLQIEKFYSSGLIPTHLDSHHHVHTYPIIRDVMEKLALEYGLPVRIHPKLSKAKPFSDKLITHFYGEKVSHKTLDDIVANAESGEVIEIMTHPAYIDSIIMKGSSYWRERLKELEVLTTWKVPNKATLSSTRI